MRNFLTLFFLLLGVVLGGYFYQPSSPTPTLKAPNFSYTSLKGETQKLSALKGKVVLIHFWASWCAPCKIEFPELLKLAENNPKTLSILAFSVDDSPRAIKKFVADKTIPKNFTLIWDEDKKISRDLFQTVNYPETVLVDCNGLMENKIIGMAQDWPAVVKPLLKQCKKY